MANLEAATAARSASAIVGAAAREHATNEDHALRFVVGEYNPPAPDAQARLRATGKRTHVDARVSRHESVERDEHAPPDGRIEPT